jgi:hypothetical protein
MLYKIVGGATIFIASLSILTQIVLLPLIFHHSENIKHVFHGRMKKFQVCFEFPYEEGLMNLETSTSIR